MILGVDAIQYGIAKNVIGAMSVGLPSVTFSYEHIENSEEYINHARTYASMNGMMLTVSEDEKLLTLRWAPET